MTRIAIVASSEALRAALAAALRAEAAFEVVSIGSDEGDVSEAADVVLVARDAEDSRPIARSGRHDLVNDVMLSNREREILALLADGLGNKPIAARLGISTNTVMAQAVSIMARPRRSADGCAARAPVALKWPIGSQPGSR